MEKWSIEKKAVLITGATSGIGLAGAKILSKAGASLILTTRSDERGEKASREIFQYSKNNHVMVLPCDLASFSSINNFVNKVSKEIKKIDILINNAGIWQPSYKQTKNRVESNFGVNHLGPFLLTNLILNKFKRNCPKRIINTTSEAHRGIYINFDDLEMINNFNGYRAYSQSKLANILFTKKLSRLLEAKQTTVNCFHPGIVRTHLFDKLNPFQRTLFSPFLISPKRGAETLVYLASSPDINEVSGEYFIKKRLARPSIEANNEEVADQLWEVSKKYIKDYL